MNNIKVLFMGTPSFCVPVLEGLISNYNVVGVVTQPDKEVGRNREIEFSPAKKVALEHNIEVFQPIKIRNDYNFVLQLNPDLIVTCAYGQIIPKEILECPRYGCINVHASLLPKFRGGAPIHRAIIEGETETGITIMYMDEHMDTGDIISICQIPIGINDNVGIIHDKLSIMGKDLLLNTIPKILDGTAGRIKQEDSLATYAPVIKREDELLDFNDNCFKVYNKIRGLNPFPVSYAMLDNKIMKIYESRIGNDITAKPGTICHIYKDGIGVATSDKELIITEIKLEGKKRMLVKDYLNGIDKDELLGKVFNGE